MITIKEPSLDEIRKMEVALSMTGVHTDLRSVDLLIRTQRAVRKMKAKFDLRTAAEIQIAVEQRWKDGTPEVVWECQGFIGYKK